MADIIHIGSRRLEGAVSVPPSKSVAHRAIIAAAMADGATTVKNIAMSEDIKATLECMRRLGAKHKAVKDGVIVEPKKSYRAPEVIELDCAESGSTLRFLMPVALLFGKTVRFTGRGRLMERPQKPYFDIFDSKGINYEKTHDSITLSGKLTAGDYVLPGNVSSQFVTGLLFALPCLEDDSTIRITGGLESKGYVDLTIDVLRSFGISIANDGYKIFKIRGGQNYKPCTEYIVENDYSQAAFFLVAGAIGNDVECLNLKEDSLQGDKKIIDIIRAAGGRIAKTERGGIKAVRTSNMHGVTIDARDIPDLVPILSVLCAFSKGESRIINAGRLRIKESDRLTAVSTELKHLGIDIIEGADYLRIRGTDLIKSNITSSWNDHRIAMSIAIAATRCEGEVSIVGGREAVKKSYPDFFEVYQSIAKD